jgi:flagellar basal body-associated protein FliL
MDENHQDRAKHQQTWWQKNKRSLVIATIIILVVLIAFALAVFLFGWDWTGLGPYTPPTKNNNFQRGKTLWDWLQLLIVPIMLVIGGFWLNQIQKSREEESAKKRAEAEYKRTCDNRRETFLQAYIDNMSELLLKEHLRESKPEDEVRKIARVRTLTVLQRLDAVRKFSVLLFLHASGLIDKGKCIVELDIANLQGPTYREST